MSNKNKRSKNDTSKDNNQCQIVLGYVQRQVYSGAELAEEVAVKETYNNELVWQGTVYVFLLKGHPKAEKCYAWYSDDPATGKRKFYSVLHIRPIDSPEKAVRASIVQDYRSGKL
jgi:hypothetical protein